MSNNNSAVDSSNSQALLNQIVLEYLREKKRKRVWQWVKRILVLILIVWMIYLLASWRTDDTGSRIKPHVGLIDIKELF